MKKINLPKPGTNCHFAKITEKLARKDEHTSVENSLMSGVANYHRFLECSYIHQQVNS